MEVIFVLTPKGGAGKTTVSEFLEAACTLGGRRVVVLDADAGNRGYLRRCGSQSAVEVDWETGHGDAAAFIVRHLCQANTVIVDFGANLLASATPVLGFLGCGSASKAGPRPSLPQVIGTKPLSQNVWGFRPTPISTTLAAFDTAFEYLSMTRRGPTLDADPQGRELAAVFRPWWQRDNGTVRRIGHGLRKATVRVATVVRLLIIR